MNNLARSGITPIKDTTTGIPGIVFRKDRYSWIARKMIKGKKQYIGYFKSLESAIEALEEFNRGLNDET